MVVLKLALIALVLVMFAPFSVVPADAESRMRCLTRDQQRTATLRRSKELASAQRRPWVHFRKAYFAARIVGN